MSDSAGLKKELEAAIAAYHKAVENVRDFETKLAAARKSEVAAVTDDSGDERAIVKRISEAQGLAAVYSRRLELAKDNDPQAFAAIPPIVKALAQDLTNRCYALAETRAAAHKQLFRARIDLETFHRQFLNSLHSFPIDFESDLDQLLDCCPDVIAAKNCVPRLSFVLARVMPPDLNFDQLQLDLNSVEEAERAYQVETARDYDFEEPAETNLIPQPVEN